VKGSTGGERSDSASSLSALRLLQLSDSALPIGSLAHSFGLETLVDRGLLSVRDLPEFFKGYLEEAGALEAVFCRKAFRLACDAGEDFLLEEWAALNRRLSALRPAREARAASITLGQNFLARIAAVENVPAVRRVLEASKSFPTSPEIHHSTGFGLVCGAMDFDEDSSIAAFLHQQIASLISACQRLLPLGQTAAARILWDLKPSILRSAERGLHCDEGSAPCFTPLLDWGAMEHPALSTRLFIS
jgi:urease accessory protein